MRCDLRPDCELWKVDLNASDTLTDVEEHYLPCGGLQKVPECEGAEVLEVLAIRQT